MADILDKEASSLNLKPYQEAKLQTLNPKLKTLNSKLKIRRFKL